MKYPSNIQELAKLSIDYMGLIFYEKSPRHIAGLNPADLNLLPTYIKRTGVFVNAPADYINEQIEKYSLDYVQLHGIETPGSCKDISKIKPVIKAFNIANKEDFEETKVYEESCEYFLFDTKTSHHGGSGKKFDWSILNSYTGETPFFLSGGISEEDAEAINSIRHLKLIGIDLNSCFESEPAIKNIQLLEKFIKNINHEQDR